MPFVVISPSIDLSEIASNLENIKFPNSRKPVDNAHFPVRFQRDARQHWWSRKMSEHPASFKVEQPISLETAVGLLAGDHNPEISIKPKRSLKDRLRRVLLATAAVAVLSG